MVVGGLGLIGGTVGISYLRETASSASASATPPPPSVDPELVKLVEGGRTALGAGDLEAAGASFQRALGRSPHDPGALAAVAELEVLRADFTWLRLRLLDPAWTERVAETHRELGSQIARASAAVDAATAPAVPEPLARRLRIDLFRLSGKVSEARSLVEPLADRASEPDTAYVLGALDLAEANQAFLSAAARLRVAAVGEGGLGRARALLIYSLAHSGDIVQARRELAQLSSASADHPLAEDLKGFVERCAAAAAGDADAGLATVDTEALRGLDAPGTASDARGGAGDFRQRLKFASAALGIREYDRAERLFRSVLLEQPGNTEALAGVAEVARQRNDPKAAELYEKVLEKNPGYVPAIVARADQKWAAGDRAGALALYQRVVSQVGTDGTYGRHAATRIAEGARSASGSGSASPPRATPPAPPAPTAPEAAEIDTSDLPGTVP